MKTYKLAIIPGDGIGPEVIAESVETLKDLARLHGGFTFDLQEFDWGTERYLREGALMPPGGLTTLERGGFDGILLGPVGDPRVPDQITLWGLVLPIRQAFDQYVNLRPARLLPGVRSPLGGKQAGDIDIVCVRENTEGEYAGAGGRVHQGSEHEVAIQSIIFTRAGTERIIRYAFEYARQYGRKKVTSATKSNSMQYNMVFWDDVFREVAADYPDIVHEQQLIDSLTARFVAKPESLDVVVASNLFGDILTDLGAAISGSLGLAPSANLNPQRRYPSLFQAIHGSAPDIAGKGVANPIASIWSAQLMLDFFGEHEAATFLMNAIEAVLASGEAHTPDLGGTATTRELGQAIRTRLQDLVTGQTSSSGQANRQPTSEEQLHAIHIGGLTPLTERIYIADYDPMWPQLFEREAKRIREALGEKVLLLEHVGSTSVPGLAAKPRIDIVLAVPDSANEASYVPALEASGYVLRIREPDWFEHRVFKGPDTDVNLHVFTQGCSEIERMLLFRDWLRTHPSDRQLYEDTKRELARQDWKYTQNYADAKTSVVDEIIGRARKVSEDSDK